MQRDIEVTRRLREEGWIVLRFWGDEIKNNPEVCADRIAEILEKRGTEK